MDTNNNSRPTPPNGDPIMDNDEWRTQLQPDSRRRIVNKIMDTLKRFLPFSGEEGLNELRKIAVRFEEKIFTAASSQSDYLRRISLKMLTMENKSQNTIPSNGNNSNPFVPGSQGMQSQVHSQGQSIPLPLQGNQSEACQQLLPQSVPNNMPSAGVQSSAGLRWGMPSVSGFKKAEDTHGIALTTDYGMPSITEQSHDTRVNMFQAKPISLKPLSATVVTMVDEAAAAVGEDLAAIRKRGLHANFFTQTGMTGAEKMRCYVSALVILALMFWFIFIHKSPILKL